MSSKPMAASSSAKKAGSRIRTDDRLITNQVLYQLSYTGAANLTRATPPLIVKAAPSRGPRRIKFISRGL